MFFFSFVYVLLEGVSLNLKLNCWLISHCLSIKKNTGIIYNFLPVLCMLAAWCGRCHTWVWVTYCNTAIFSVFSYTCVSLLWQVKISVVKRLSCCHLLFLAFLDNSFHSSLIVIRKLLTCRFCHVASHSFTWNSICTNISFPLNDIFTAFNQVCYFRALDIYSANSVNIVFLQQPSLVWSKPELMAIAACIYCWFSCVILLSAS